MDSTTRPRRGILLLGALAAAALVLVGCTVDPISSSAESGETRPEGPVRIAMVTHGDDGGFWSVVRRGATDASESLDVVLDYQAAANDSQLQDQMIKAALLAGAEALAVSAADEGAVRSGIAQAAQAGIPIVTFNSGAQLAEANDAIMVHVGQSEFIAGEEAGRRMGEAGFTKVLCIIHEQNNIGLQERCDGARTGLEDSGAEAINVQVTGKADPGSTAREVAAAVAAQSPDAVLTLDPDIAMAALGSIKDTGVPLATFDLSADVLDAVSVGDILFAIDQQQYMQGYLPIVFLELAVRNGNEVVGDIVLTGPSFITQDNAADVAALAEQGTR